jgi:hypothetical protein
MSRGRENTGRTSSERGVGIARIERRTGSLQLMRVMSWPLPSAISRDTTPENRCDEKEKTAAYDHSSPLRRTGLHRWSLGSVGGFEYDGDEPYGTNVSAEQRAWFRK